MKPFVELTHLSLTCIICFLSQVNFGNPFILQIGEEETLADIKPRIQVIILATPAILNDHLLLKPVPSSCKVLLHGVSLVQSAAVYCSPYDNCACMQTKLGVSQEEFVKWKFAFMTNLRQPDYLEDEDVVALRFARQSATHGVSTETSYLGMEHADTGPKRPHPNSNRFSQYERPVKIYN